MKQVRHVLPAAAVALALGALVAEATLAQTGDTRPIQVTAAVKGSCRFEATPNISFGDLDPATAADRIQGVDVTFKCTKGVSYTFTIGDGLNNSGGKNRMKSAAGTDYIPYDITPKTLSGSGQGFETSATIKIEGAVKGIDYRNAPVGAYADTVTLSIQP